MVMIQVLTNKKQHSFVLCDCLYISSLFQHLLSISYLLQRKFSVMLSQSLPHILFGYTQCLTNLNIPKFLSLTHLKDEFYLKGVFIPLPSVVSDPMTPPLIPLLTHLTSTLHAVTTIPQSIIMIFISPCSPVLPSSANPENATGTTGCYIGLMLWNGLLSYLISSYQPCLSHLIK